MSKIDLSTKKLGEPLIGAIVSLDGIEAEAVSNELGEFEVFGISSASEQLLTVNAEGYTPIYRLVRPYRTRNARLHSFELLVSKVIWRWSCSFTSASTKSLRCVEPG